MPENTTARQNPITDAHMLELMNQINTSAKNLLRGTTPYDAVSALVDSEQLLATLLAIQKISYALTLYVQCKQTVSHAPNKLTELAEALANGVDKLWDRSTPYDTKSHFIDTQLLVATKEAAKHLIDYVNSVEQPATEVLTPMDEIENAAAHLVELIKRYYNTSRSPQLLVSDKARTDIRWLEVHTRCARSQ